jgi:DNA-binding protein HU-beta
VNAVLDTIQDAVAKGDKVAITGFGVFEKSERPARTARNPATGATIQVPKSSVPKFRPGADFKALVNGDTK